MRKYAMSDGMNELNSSLKSVMVQIDNSVILECRLPVSSLNVMSTYP